MATKKKSDESAKKQDVEEPRYEDALKELEEILEQIERDEVDLDDLGAKVERAAALIVLCRDKIERTQMRVRKIVDVFDANQEDV